MTAYDFTRLSPTQQSILTFGGWHVSDAAVRHQPRKDTVAKLIERGLVVASTREVVPGRFSVAEYEVPTAVHAAWCKHCSRRAHR